MTKIIKKTEKSLNRHWKNFLDKDYLGSHNLEEDEDMILTIADFKGDELVKTKETPKGEAKIVLYFKENVQKMILNITNANTISSMYGTHPASWIGKKIQIYVREIRAFGVEQPALRIRDVIPKESVDNAAALRKIGECKDNAQLKDAFLSLSESERNDIAVIKLTNNLKAKYASN
jgi:hypothetical protein